MSAAAEPARSNPERLLRLFEGAQTHHGTYNHLAVVGSSSGEKVEIKGSARTVPEPPTLRLWEKHVAGEQPLGVSPVRDDSMSVWGCVDVDSYDVDHVDLVDRCGRLGLPMLVCRSKSGGAHLFVFVAEPVPAAEMRRALRGARRALGLPDDTEIFPKQDRAGRTNWLNMPYFGGDNTDRHAFSKRGAPMSLSAFLAEAEDQKQPAERLEQIASMAAPKAEKLADPTASEFDQWLGDALATLEQAPPGKRDDTLAIAVARDAGRWAAVGMDLAEAECRAREVWHRLGKSDRDFDQQWHHNVERGRALGNPPRPRAGTAVVRNLGDVTMKPVDWLWPGRFALGKLSLVAGHPGLGKSQLTMHLAAVVSRGGSWPFGEGRAPIGRVLVLSAEDDAADTLLPRLLAAGGDPAMVDLLEAVRQGDGERMFDLAADAEALDRTLGSRDGYRLLIVDPISAYMGRGKVDSNRNTDVRGVLAPIQKLAERHGIAVVLVSHLIKAGGREAIGSVTGSGAFVAAVRTACFVTRETEEEEDDDGRTVKKETGRRELTMGKNNIGPDGAAMALVFRVESRDVGGGIAAPAIVWDEKTEMTADEAVGFRGEAAGPGRRPSALETAKGFLRRTLRGGRMLSSELEGAATAAGISPATLRNAKKALGIVAEKEAGDGGRWWSSLPGEQQELPI